MPLILASGSPRRRMLLTAVGAQLDAIRPPSIAEVPRPGEGAVAYVRRLAAEKAAAVDAPTAWVLAADTTVHRDGEIFEKPADAADAVRMLLALGGRWHAVSTGWCLRWGGPEPRAGARLDVVTTRVLFRPLSASQAEAYVALGESLDKAGAYGIQGAGAALVDRVEGSHSNVVGLPLDAVVPALLAVGLLPGAPASAARDTPARDTPARDTPARDTPARDTPARDTPAQDTPARDTPARDTPAPDTAR